MRKLTTIQTKEKLNDVYAADQPGPGNACHDYVIVKHEDDVEEEFYYGSELAEITFQCRPRKEESSIHGVIDSDLLEIVRDRLISFQSGDYANEYNKTALEHVELALKALNDRVEDRAKRNVLGTNDK